MTSPHIGQIVLYHVSPTDVLDLRSNYVDGKELIVEIKPNYGKNSPQNITKFAAAQQQFGDRFEIWSEELIFQQ